MMMIFMNNQKCLTRLSTLTGLGFLALFLLPGPGICEDEHEHGHQGEVEEAEHQAVVLSPEELTEFHIETALVGAGQIPLTLSFPAEIHANDDNLAHIVPRYEGIVTDVLVHVGDRVEVGQTLANIEGDASLAVYPLKTRIDGIVISKHITRGEAASRDRAPFVIADLSTVWLDIHVFQRDLLRVDEGQPVTVVAGPEGMPVHGVVSYMSPVVDEITRTSVARAVLDNSRGVWRPGMFVTATVEVGIREAEVVAPASALFSIHGETAVFIADGHGFEVRNVTTGSGNGEWVEILTGLKVGVTIVAKGGFTIKAELEKSSFGDGHNH